MYDIMKSDVTEYLDNKEYEKKDEIIKEEEKLDISIYLRY
jgi:hypothetical protein